MIFFSQSRYHHVYFDNYFSSIELLVNLAKDDIYACGTLRSNRVGFPTDLLRHVREGLKSRSDYCVRQCKKAKNANWTKNQKQSNRLAVSLWQDNRPVVVASTNCNPAESTHEQRRQKDGSRLSVQCPSSISLYNTYIDHNDQLRGYYSLRTKGKKCYKYIWWFLFDVAVTNMYILAKYHSPMVVKSVKQFRASLARDLIGDFQGRKRRGRPVSSSNPSHQFCVNHFPMKSTKQGRCHYCYYVKKRRHDTSWWCTTCKKHLCHEGNVNDCFLLYHTKLTINHLLLLRFSKYSVTCVADTKQCKTNLSEL